MIRRPGPKCVKSEPLNLLCEWGSCFEVFTDLSDFYAHLEGHYQHGCRNLETFQSELICNRPVFALH